MISRRNKPRKINGINKVRKILIAFILVVVIILFSIDLSLRPSMNKALDYQSRVITTNIMSDVTVEVLDEMKIDYGSIVHINKDSNGEIIGIETDMTAVNKLKALLTSRITSELNNQKTYPYSLSLGSLLGNDYLSGRGPEIQLRIEPTGYLKSETVSKFTSVGINQTLHQIILNMTADITTIVPLHNSTTVISTNFIIAETVIVGDIPQYYTNVITDDKSLVEDLNDYAPNTKN